MRDALRYRLMASLVRAELCVLVSGLYNQFMRSLILIVGPYGTYHFGCRMFLGVGDLVAHLLSVSIER